MVGNVGKIAGRAFGRAIYFPASQMGEPLLEHVMRRKRNRKGYVIVIEQGTVIFETRKYWDARAFCCGRGGKLLICRVKWDTEQSPEMSPETSKKWGTAAK